MPKADQVGNLCIRGMTYQGLHPAELILLALCTVFVMGAILQLCCYPCK